MIIVTGGAGFIGSNFIHQWLKAEEDGIVNLDCLSYAGNLENLASVEKVKRYHFVKGSIGNRKLLKQLLAKSRPRAIIHFAAESHVDRSIHYPEHFIDTNVVGTCALLAETLRYWQSIESAEEKRQFRFLHVSTDEVFGSLDPKEKPATEERRYAPNSPYAASKAASDHFVRAYTKTYGLPTIITYCSNNYGPYQFPEKLIPLVITNALSGKPIPLYGDGKQIRNWLYVEDHCQALRLLLRNGAVGEHYNIGDIQELSNFDVVKSICSTLDELLPQSPHLPHEKLITFVEDRPGHDFRYSLDISKIKTEFGWSPSAEFPAQLKKTIAWYLENEMWLDHVQSGAYQDWIKTNYRKKQ